MSEHLDAAYAQPPHIRQVAVKMAQQIALTADPVKTTLEATFTEFLGQFSCTSKSGNSVARETMASLKNQADKMSVSAPTAEEIAQRAFEIFLARGGEPGHDLDDWLQAEAELLREHAARRSLPGN